jgi:hypothetical protein
MWQYSLDNANWIDWGEGVSSPGGSVNNNPFYIRVRLSSGPGCVAYTSVLTVTPINPPAISMNSATICPGQSATLHVNGYDTNLGSYEMSRFGSSVDPRGTLSVSGDMALLSGITYTSGYNTFLTRRTGNGFGYADYYLNLNAWQNLSTFEAITVDHGNLSTVRYDVFIYDTSAGWVFLGGTAGRTTGVNRFDLPINATSKGKVTAVLVRMYNTDIPVGGAETFDMYSIKAVASAVVWSTGAKTTSITASPGSTMSYNVTAYYGGCTTGATGTIVVTQVAPSVDAGQVCVSGEAITNLYANDLINGVQATSSNSTASQVGSWQPGITLNSTTGAISVASGTPAGVYPVTYKLCSGPSINVNNFQYVNSQNGGGSIESLFNGVDEISSGSFHAERVTGG